jgi:hypothetical protein
MFQELACLTCGKVYVIGVCLNGGRARPCVQRERGFGEQSQLRADVFWDHIPSVLIKHNWFAPNWVSAREIANPGNVINQIRRWDTRDFLAHLVISLP